MLRNGLLQAGPNPACFAASKANGDNSDEFRL